MLLGCSVIWVMSWVCMFWPDTSRFDIPVTWLFCGMLSHIPFCCGWVWVVKG